MSMDERIQKLDEHVGNRVRQWLKDVHEQVGHQLGEEISRQLAAAGDLLPDSLLTEEAIEPLRGTEQASGDAVGLKRLKVATAAIDGARNQSEVLSELLTGGQSFASRLALFLTRADAASGWSGIGFGDGDGNIRGMTLDYQEDGPWYRLSMGRACVPLSAGDCGRLCSRLESALPKEGILIPIVLRDRVAATLYADRLLDEDVLDLDALQILTYLAAQAIETLPFRDRKTTTPTLLVEEEAEDDRGGLSLWGAAATAAAVTTAAVAGAVLADDDGTEAESQVEEAEETSSEEEAEEASSEEEELAPVELEVVEPVRSETQDLAPTVAEAIAQESAETGSSVELSEPSSGEEEVDATAEADEEDQLSEVEVVEVEASSIEYVEVEAEAEESEVDASLEAGAAVAVPDSLPWETEDLAEETPQAASTAVWDEQPAVEVEAETSGGGILWEAEEEPPVVSEAEIIAEQAPEEPASVEWQTEPDSVAPEGVAIPDSGLKTLQYTPPVLESETTPEEPAQFEGDETVLLSQRPSLVPPAPAPDEPPAFDGDETHPGVAIGAPPEAPEPPPVEPEAPAAPRPAPRATEVAPPSDIDGPGWAFKSPAVVGEDAEMHDKAKRLARLLVSEIKLYNEEQVEEGQRNRDIYERLKEDIDRSRQMYEDRVDERIRSTNDYFYQELVRTLAAGDPQALGI